MIYWLLRFLIRRIFRMTMRVRRQGLENLALPGGYLLACSHASHLDPFCLSAIVAPRVHWMARVEFFRQRWSERLMRLVGAFPVNRQGVPVSAIRYALRQLAAGEIVGIFPEGEIKSGADSVVRGGPLKRGVCLLAARSGKPVIPCIIAGAEKLNAPGPWLPFLRGRLWVICGKPIAPITGPDRRAARAEMAARLEREFVALYAEMRRSFDLKESIVP